MPEYLQSSLTLSENSARVSAVLPYPIGDQSKSVCSPPLPYRRTALECLQSSLTLSEIRACSPPLSAISPRIFSVLARTARDTNSVKNRNRVQIPKAIYLFPRDKWTGKGWVSGVSFSFVAVPAVHGRKL